MQSYGDGVSEFALGRFRGARIVVSSGGQITETVTSEDGSFIISGIQPGRLTLTPVLPQNFGIVNKAAQQMDIGDGGCKVVDLRADIDGRVSGRFSAPPASGLTACALFFEDGPTKRGLPRGMESLSQSHMPLA
jgi:hypothetical protein